MAEDWKEQYDYYFNKVNNANVESAKKQMDFQERMSSTAHEREVKDLIAAGLNPVLSANNGASSPMGAYASVDSSAISAKFARQNLEKELENARLITSMQNDNQMKIAIAQLANQMELGKYTADLNNKTSRFNTIVDKYGIFAGLAYGLAEDMFNGSNIQEEASNLLNDHNKVQQLLSSVGNTAKDSSIVQKVADFFLNGGFVKEGQNLLYGDKGVVFSNNKQVPKSVVDKANRSVILDVSNRNRVKRTINVMKRSLALNKLFHTNAFTR